MTTTTPEDLELTSSELRYNLPPTVRAALAKLTPQQRSLFFDEFSHRRKNLGLAYLFWIILALHYVYLDKWYLTVLQLLTSFVLVGIVWWIIDAFRMPSMVSNFNRDVALEVMRTQKMIVG